MSNGFSRHGIEHLSASSLTLWAAEPAVWAMERLLGHRSPPSALMARGKALLKTDVAIAVPAGTYGRVGEWAAARPRRASGAIAAMAR